MPPKTSDAAPFEVAREHAVSDVPIVEPGATKADILNKLQAKRYLASAHIAVCQEGAFLGIIRIEDLMPAPDRLTAAEIMDPDPPLIKNGMDQEVAAWMAVQSRESALAVVGVQGRFLGIIPALALQQILFHEHEEDLSRLGGYLKGTAMTRNSAMEKVFLRFWHRLPWLILGLCGAGLSAGIISRFERVISDHLILAFFLPGIVYLSDAVGTQTETVIVRGLSVGVRLRQFLIRELLTGFLIGLVLAAAAFLILRWQLKGEGVAFGISLSILLACSTASATAMILPWILSRLDLDPAYGSGPIATVIQDLLSILIYFSIATRFL